MAPSVTWELSKTKEVIYEHVNISQEAGIGALQQWIPN